MQQASVIVSDYATLMVEVLADNVEIAEDALKSTVEAEIAVASVHTANAARDEHLRTGDYFDVTNHPTARFVSTDLIADGERYTLTGLRES